MKTTAGRFKSSAQNGNLGLSPASGPLAGCDVITEGLGFGKGRREEIGQVNDAISPLIGKDLRSWFEGDRNSSYASPNST